MHIYAFVYIYIYIYIYEIYMIFIMRVLYYNYIMNRVKSVEMSCPSSSLTPLTRPLCFTFTHTRDGHFKMQCKNTDIGFLKFNRQHWGPPPPPIRALNMEAGHGGILLPYQAPSLPLVHPTCRGRHRALTCI